MTTARFDVGKFEKQIDLIEKERDEYREALEFYADNWAACQPNDTAETCAHFIGEVNGGAKARAVLKKWKK